MKLYIQVENGSVVNHPAFEDNLIQAFGEIPSNWKSFIRVPQPDEIEMPVGTYQVPVCTYTLSSDGTYWSDVWTVRDMTPEEKQAKIDAAYANNDYPSWVFNEAECVFYPPVPKPPRPETGYWMWDEPTVSWVIFYPQEVTINDVSF